MQPGKKSFSVVITSPRNSVGSHATRRLNSPPWSDCRILGGAMTEKIVSNAKATSSFVLDIKAISQINFVAAP
jgi:hypothetical protein